MKKQKDWKESTKLLMESWGDDPKDFPFSKPEERLAVVRKEHIYNNMEAIREDWELNSGFERDYIIVKIQP